MGLWKFLGNFPGIIVSRLTGFAATTAHMAAIWGTAIAIEPKLDIAPPITEWEPKDVAIDFFHHAVYALVAGLVYDAID